MLKRMCSERPKDWDRYLNSLLFAYREVPQESLKFSPFELVYGRTVRGRMPNAEEMFAKLAGYKYFSRTHLSKGYWQLSLSEAAKPKTSFQTPKGLFEFI